MSDKGEVDRSDDNRSDVTPATSTIVTSICLTRGTPCSAVGLGLICLRGTFS